MLTIEPSAMLMTKPIAACAVTRHVNAFALVDILAADNVRSIAANASIPYAMSDCHVGTLKTVYPGMFGSYETTHMSDGPV